MQEHNTIENTKQLNNPRDESIDLAKGVCILLVVLGHSIQTVSSNMDENIVFRFIYSFHMPFFFFLSGYIAFKTFDDSFIKLLRKIQRLIIPFITWGFISILITHFVQGGRLHIIENIKLLIVKPDHGLWFLVVLFYMYLLLFTALKFSKILKIQDYSFFVFFIIGSLLVLLPVWKYGVNLLKHDIMYFILGYFFSKYKMADQQNYKKIRWISIPLFIIFASSWHRLSYDEAWRRFLPLCIYQFVTAFSGIIAVLTLLDLFKKKNSSISKLGRYTLEIYCIHFYFLFSLLIHYPKDNPLFVILAFIVAIVGSFIVQTIIKRSTIFSFLCFGKSFSMRK